MAKRRSDQEWHALFEQYEASDLTQRAISEQNNLSPSTEPMARQKDTPWRLRTVPTELRSSEQKLELIRNKSP